MSSTEPTLTDALTAVPAIVLATCKSSRQPVTSDTYKQVLAAPRVSFVPETVEQIRAAKAEIVQTNIDSSERLASLGEPAGTFALRYVLWQLAKRRNMHARVVRKSNAAS